MRINCAVYLEIALIHKKALYIASLAMYNAFHRLLLLFVQFTIFLYFNLYNLIERFLI